MRVLQRGGQLDFAAEAILIHAGRHVGRQHLNDDFAMELYLFGQKHAAHATAAEFFLDAVGVADGGLDAVDEIGHAQRGSVSVRLGLQLAACSGQ